MIFYYRGSLQLPPKKAKDIEISKIGKTHPPGFWISRIFRVLAVLWWLRNRNSRAQNMICLLPKHSYNT